MTPAQRTVLVAVVTAAVLGFAGGWFARTWSQPSLEDRAHETVEGARQRLRSFAH